jgi:hypothetical protein
LFVVCSWHVILTPLRSPPQAWWWLNIKGETDNGTTVELIANGAWYLAAFNTPYSAEKMQDDGIENSQRLSMRNHRWFKYMENGYLSDWGDVTTEVRLQWGRWLCRQYLDNEANTRLKSWTLFLISEMLEKRKDETVERQSEERVEVSRKAIWNHQCF